MSKERKELRNENCPALNLDPVAGRPVITVDYDLYAHYLEDTDLSEDEKREFLQTLWNIVCEFVTMGFGVHPVQQIQKTCGKLPETALKTALAEPDKVQYLDRNLVTKFMNATTAHKMPEQEGVKNEITEGD